MKILKSIRRNVVFLIFVALSPLFIPVLAVLFLLGLIAVSYEFLFRDEFFSVVISNVTGDIIDSTINIIRKLGGEDGK